MQTAEAAEDAELQILLSNPALRQPLAPAALPERDTLNTISGFQGFQEAIPADSARLAVPVTAESPASSPARRRASELGPQAETSMTDDADMAGMTDAAESSARAGDAEGLIGVARRGRGTWGTIKQPFIAAGRHTGSNETATQLLSSGALPMVVASCDNRDATGVAEAQPQVAAGLVESTQHEVAAAESAVDTSAADSELPHSHTSPEEARCVINATPAATSVRQQLADAEQAQQQHAQQQNTQQDQQQRAQQAQQATATAEGCGQVVDKPAAGSYRRVAWGPVQNPFPAAGAISARTASAGAAFAGMVASGATAAEAAAAPASVPSSCVDTDQLADSTQDMRPEHASDCTESEQASEPAQHSAQQLVKSPSQEPELTHNVAQDLEGTQGASGAQSNEAAAAAAAVPVPATDMVQQGCFACRLVASASQNVGAYCLVSLA